MPPDALWCPACGGTDFRFAFTAREMFHGDEVDIDQCRVCGLHATAGRPEREELARWYHYEGGAAADERFSGLLELLMRRLRAARASALTGLVGHTSGRVLDVGCGRGVMLEVLQQRGWSVWGTEIDEAVAASAQARLGPERVWIGDLPECPFAGPFELIVFFHVLEHLSDPYAALQRARELLAPNGAVVVSVPNLESLQAKLVGPQWLHLDVPRHRWHFTPATLTRLAERAGLRVHRRQSFSLEYGPVGWVQGGLSKLGLGHVLFTDILRSGRRAWRKPGVWAHAALAGPIAATSAAALPLEWMLSKAGLGGNLLVVLDAGESATASPTR